MTHDGQLGIGVATPASLLHVAGTVQVGVDDTGHDVIFYGDAAGAFAMWDTSANSLLVRGAAADAVGSTGRIVLQTAQPDVRAADVLGRIDFQAPLDTQGTDGILVTASITGVAEETFTASVNGTALTFAVADGDAVVEAMRITHDGFVGIGTTAPTGFLHIFDDDTSHGINAAADNLVIEGTGVIGMTFASDADMSIAFSDNDNSMNSRIMYDLSEGDLTFWTNELQRVTFDAGGLVGIGTVTPSAPLDIVMSHTDSTVANMSDNEVLELTNSGAGNGVYNAIGFHGNQQSMYMAAFNNASSSARRIALFCGTVAGDAAADEQFAVKGNGVPSLRLGNSDDGYVVNVHLNGTASGYHNLYRKADSTVFTGYHYYAKVDPTILYTEDDTIPDGKEIGDVKTQGETFEMGDVVVVTGGKATKCTAADATNVAGIISGHPMPGGRWLSNNKDDIATEEHAVELACLGDSQDWNKIVSLSNRF